MAAFASALVISPLAEAIRVTISLSAPDAAFLAGTSAVVNLIAVVARWRLSVLPDAGVGLQRS